MNKDNTQAVRDFEPDNQALFQLQGYKQGVLDAIAALPKKTDVHSAAWPALDRAEANLTALLNGGK